MSDEVLAQALSRGDQSALAPLVERYHARLFGFLYRLSGGDRTLTEDWVQETFVRLLRAIRQYEYPRPFKPYLFAIAANLARDHFKSAAARRTAQTVATDEFAAIPDDAPPAEAHMLAVQTADRVAAALGSLPDHQRAVIILRYYEEWSLAEIAGALEIPVGTVKSRISLGLKRLSHLLTEEKVYDD